jgi:nucleoside phosphorylase
MAAAKLMLETFHPRLSQPQTDHNVYTLGSISGHNIVIACLPSGVYGITSAAIVLDQMLSTFPQLRSGLMVGVGGGVPGPGKTDIRLGDVVVSMPTSGSTLGGVVQYDYGKALYYGTFQQTGSLNKPPRYLLTAISQLRSEDLVGDISSRIEQTISDVLASKEPKVRDQFSRPNDDWLFKSSYHHHRSDDADCSACDHTQLVFREPRGSKNPVIHYGLIASGNQVLKDPVRRDALAREMDILCFEMEAAGLVDQLSCLVIRGICDYCDSHKHKKWQGYAALTAAAYTKALLDVVPSQDRKEPACQGWVSPSPRNLERIKDILQPSVHPLDTFQNIGKRRLPGTADWVRNEPLFRAWAECNDSPVLWVSGTPGCGKSFIAQNIIAHFLERFLQCDATRQNRTSVGYFFSDTMIPRHASSTVH